MASAAAAAMLTGACPEENVCTQVGCAWDPWITVIDDGTMDGHLREGTYVFRLESALVTLEWTCALAAMSAPDPACDRSNATAEGEFDGEPVVWLVQAAHRDDGLAIELVEIREQGRVFAGPDELTITVSRDGATVIAATQRPEYVGRWPNGEECGPYCAAATEPFVVHVPAE